MVIKNVTAEDGGIYKIFAKNELGEDNTQIELIVKSAPKIIRRMENLTVLRGETAKMSVQIQASPAPDVRWLKNNQPIGKSNRIQMGKEGDDVYTLTLTDASLEDMGSYSVVAKNEINETSQFWDFNVKYPPRITKPLEKNLLIEEDDTLNLSIEVDSDFPATVVWKKDKQVLQEYDRTSFKQEGKTYSMQIISLIDEDTATYTAEVINKDGKVSTQSKVQV